MTNVTIGGYYGDDTMDVLLRRLKVGVFELHSYRVGFNFLKLKMDSPGGDGVDTVAATHTLVPPPSYATAVASLTPYPTLTSSSRSSRHSSPGVSDVTERSKGIDAELAKILENDPFILDHEANVGGVVKQKVVKGSYSTILLQMNNESVNDYWKLIG